MPYARKDLLTWQKGIHKAEDCLKVIMAGASVTMLCSSLLRFGIGHIRHVDSQLRAWMTPVRPSEHLGFLTVSPFAWSKQ